MEVNVAGIICCEMENFCELWELIVANLKLLQK